MSSANNLEEPLLPGMPPEPAVETQDPEPLRLVPRRLIVEEERVLPDRKPRRVVDRVAPSTTPPATLADAQIAAPPNIPPAPLPPTNVDVPPAPRVTPRDIHVAAMFEAISKVLSIRWLLTVAIAGSFALGLLVKDVWSGAAFLVFTSFSIPALVLMERLQRPK